MIYSSSVEGKPQKQMREWLSGGASPCQGEGRGFESRLALFLLRKIKGFREIAMVTHDYPHRKIYDLIVETLLFFSIINVLDQPPSNGLL